MWLLSYPRCKNCRAYVTPTGYCEACRQRNAPHVGTWVQYYAESERQKKMEARGMGFVFTIIAWVFLIALMLWSLV